MDTAEVCCVRITFTLLPTNRFVSSTTNSTKGLVSFIQMRICVRLRNTQPHLNTLCSLIPTSIDQFIFHTLLGATKITQCPGAYRTPAQLKPDNSNSHEFELHRPSNKGTKLLLKVIKAIIIILDIYNFVCLISRFSLLNLDTNGPDVVAECWTHFPHLFV